MLLKILFWAFVAVDVCGIGLFFLLGLAAAGSTKDSPLAVLGVMVVLPGTLLVGAIWLWQRADSTLLRVLAYLLVSAPIMTLVIGRLVAEIWVRANPNAVWGETELTRALQELETDPSRLQTLRELLAAGADPNEAGNDLPLVLAIRLVRQVGDEPLRLLLDAGADPNQATEFGRPAFFAACGSADDVAVMRLLLERGADPKRVERDGRSAVWTAVNTRNWAVARLLVDRGAGVHGISPMGLPLVAVLEGEQRELGGGGGLAELLAAVRARSK
ncbi:MAG: ankyrin repeat domain-containing protein [Planctomycetes bacterium]|nr:ankyrin repeat domain-containing protein [Planctomycetota bacterium]